MPRRLVSAVLGAVLVAAVGALVRAQTTPAAPAQTASFASDVAPILESRCLSCHGDTMQMGKLDLRTREAALRGGTRGSDLVPNDAEASRVSRGIAGLEKPAMPAQGGPLTAAQVEVIKRWIDEGAAWGTAALTTNAASAATALAALEKREITPEERNYWAFKLPV